MLWKSRIFVWHWNNKLSNTLPIIYRVLIFISTRMWYLLYLSMPLWLFVGWNHFIWNIYAPNHLSKCISTPVFSSHINLLTCLGGAGIDNCLFPISWETDNSESFQTGVELILRYKMSQAIFGMLFSSQCGIACGYILFSC